MKSFKVYTEIISDPKLRSLPLDERWVWVAIMSVVCDLGPDDSTIPAMSRKNLATRTTDGDTHLLERALRDFEELGMIELLPDGSIFITHWSYRQSLRPSETREAVRDRVRKCRERKRAAAGTGVTEVTRYTPVTPVTCNDQVTRYNEPCNDECNELAVTSERQSDSNALHVTTNVTNVTTEIVTCNALPSVDVTNVTRYLAHARDKSINNINNIYKPRVNNTPSTEGTGGNPDILFTPNVVNNISARSSRERVYVRESACESACVGEETLHDAEGKPGAETSGSPMDDPFDAIFMPDEEVLFLNGQPLPARPATGSAAAARFGIDTGTGTGTGPGRRGADYKADPLFCEFWATYPRNVDGYHQGQKVLAWKAWNDIPADERPLVPDALRKYIRTSKVKAGFVMAEDKWLDTAWRDYLEEPEPPVLQAQPLPPQPPRARYETAAERKYARYQEFINAIPNGRGTTQGDTGTSLADLFGKSLPDASG